MTRKQISSKGGRAVVAKYGKDHMRKLAQLWHAKYKMVKYDINDYLIVNRLTGKINKLTLNGQIYNPSCK